MPRIALTGGTGFVGHSLLAGLASRAESIAALVRARPGRQMQNSTQLRWISGDLDNDAALQDLTRGADVVIHLAGATKALSPAEFHRINATATKRLVQAAQAAGVGHFILLSSLAATRPEVSPYAASKAAGEVAARAHAGTMPLTIVRAPAVLGPDDQATEPLFAMIAKGWIPVPGGKARRGRFSMIDVDDLCTFLLSLLDPGARPAQTPCLAPYGHQRLCWQDLADSGARVTGRRVRQLVLPGPVLTLAGHGADFSARLTRRAQVFSSGKVQEMRAGDWVADMPLKAPTPLDVTIQRCLAPFLGLGTAQSANVTNTDRSPE